MGRPNVMSQGDYIDKLIRSEEAEKRRGYQQRIRDLKQLKENQNLISDVKGSDYKPFQQYKDVQDFIANDLDEQKLKEEAEAIKREKKKMAEEKRRKEKQLQKEKA